MYLQNIELMAPSLMPIQSLVHIFPPDVTLQLAAMQMPKKISHKGSFLEGREYRAKNGWKCCVEMVKTWNEAAMSALKLLSWLLAEESGISGLLHCPRSLIKSNQVHNRFIYWLIISKEVTSKNQSSKTNSE